MWIRSQDNKKMIKTRYIGISEECKEEVLVDDCGGLIIVAKFDTAERALEVMNYIQNKIMKGDKAYSMPEK